MNKKLFLYGSLFFVSAFHSLVHCSEGEKLICYFSPEATREGKVFNNVQVLSETSETNLTTNERVFFTCKDKTIRGEVTLNNQIWHIHFTVSLPDGNSYESDGTSLLKKIYQKNCINDKCVLRIAGDQTASDDTNTNSDPNSKIFLAYFEIHKSDFKKKKIEQASKINQIDLDQNSKVEINSSGKYWNAYKNFAVGGGICLFGAIIFWYAKYWKRT